MDDRAMMELFVQEAIEHIHVLESALLKLESSPGDEAATLQALRQAHSIKGASDYTGLKGVSRLGHALEDVLIASRESALELSPNVVSALLDGVDLLRDGVRHWASPEHRIQEIELLIERYLQFNRGESRGQAARPVEGEDSLNSAFRRAGARHIGSMRGALRRARSESSAEDALQLLREVATTFHNAASYVDAREVQDALEAIRDIVDDDNADDEQLSSFEESLDTIEGLLQDQSDSLEPTTPQSEPTSPTEAEPAAPRDSGAPAGAKSESVQPPMEAVGSREGIRVPMEKLDGIMALVSDLVVLNNTFTHVLSEAGTGEQGTQLTPMLVEKAQQLDRITRTLQKEALSARLVPVSTLFDRFPRAVRDIARAESKEVTLDVQGSETELDKSVADRLHSPLLHLIRNAIAHGIEAPAHRRSTGKSSEGVVTLRAEIDGNHISITVSDDGRGLDPLALAQSAIRKGIITKEQCEQMSPAEIVDLIFLPGFTTVESADGLAGRGVGLDAAVTAMQSMGGGLQVDWESGRHTTFVLKAPLSVGIIDAMIVRVGEERYALPTIFVEENLRIEPGRISAIAGAKAIVHEGEPVPVRSLRNLFQLPEQSQGPSKEGIAGLLLRSGSQRLVVTVDAFTAQHDVLVRPLSPDLLRLGRFSGATLMGDGRLVLIVDPRWLFARREHG